MPSPRGTGDAVSDQTPTRPPLSRYGGGVRRVVAANGLEVLRWCRAAPGGREQLRIERMRVAGGGSRHPQPRRCSEHP